MDYFYNDLDDEITFFDPRCDGGWEVGDYAKVEEFGGTSDEEDDDDDDDPRPPQQVREKMHFWPETVKTASGDDLNIAATHTQIICIHIFHRLLTPNSYSDATQSSRFRR